MDELLAAFFTLIATFARVDGHVAFKCAFLSELFSANVALERANSSVHEGMNAQSISHFISHATNVTGVLFGWLFMDCTSMFAEKFLRFKVPLALQTIVWCLPNNGELIVWLWFIFQFQFFVHVFNGICVNFVYKFVGVVIAFVDFIFG